MELKRSMTSAFTMLELSRTAGFHSTVGSSESLNEILAMGCQSMEMIPPRLL